MKKIFKNLILVFALLTFGIVSVNADTIYVGDKKYTVKDIETDKSINYLFSYNDKTYAGYKQLAMGSEEEEQPEEAIYEVQFKDKITLNKDFDFNALYNEVSKKYKNYKSEYYRFDYGEEKFYKVTVTFDDETETKVASEIDNLEGYKRLEGIYNGKYYLINEKNDPETFISERSIIVLDKDLKIIKTIKEEDLIKKATKDTENCNYYIQLTQQADNEDPYYVLRENKNNYENDTYTTTIKYYVFDNNLNLYTTIDQKSSNITYEVQLLLNNNEVKLLNKQCDEKDYRSYNCELFLFDKTGKKETIIKTDKGLNVDVRNGFVITSEYGTGELNSKMTYYDNNFNKIYEADASLILSRVIEGDDIMNMGAKVEENRYRSYYNTIQNGNYLFIKYTYTENDKADEEFYYLTIDDIRKTTISGTIKDKDGNPLKNHTVELHSTPRTVKTDENGYFIFEDVEEGDHTITIINPDGKTLATKNITVVASNETRIDGDTLYFNKDSEGFDIELKIDGEKLTIEKILDEVKEKGSIVKLLSEKVPKTADSIILYIIALISFVFGGIIIKRKINKMN